MSKWWSNPGVEPEHLGETKYMRMAWDPAVAAGKHCCGENHQDSLVFYKI